jgi:hypothetical protein
MMNTKRCVLAFLVVAACAPSEAEDLFWSGAWPLADGSGGESGTSSSSTSSSSSASSSSSGGSGGAASTGAGGSGGDGGAGGAPECSQDSDCPTLAQGCITQRCDAGACVDDEVAPDQTPCKGGYCDSVLRACRPVATCEVDHGDDEIRRYSCGQNSVYYVRFRMNMEVKTCEWNQSTWGACTPGTTCVTRLGVLEFSGICVE